MAPSRKSPTHGMQLATSPTLSANHRMGERQHQTAIQAPMAPANRSTQTKPV